MDAMASVALVVGARALDALNHWVEDRETAISWYGKEAHKKFTTRKWFWPFQLKIRKVLSIRNDNWQKVIESCLSGTGTWYRQAQKDSGECCWLPIYHSLPKETKKDCLLDPKRSLTSLGMVKSLPAARMDAWGLTVLALANGAKPEVSSANGGYFVLLDGNHFVLTMWQENIAAPVIGHIEPKQSSSLDYNQLTSPEWNMLLWHGHSFNQHNHIFGWPLNGIPPQEPPEDLVTHSRDGEIEQLVMDHVWVKRLQGQLRQALYRCYDSWEAIKIHQPGPNQALNNRIDLIQRHILALKLILVDDVQPAETALVDEVREMDVLHYTVKELKFIKDEINKREAWFEGLERNVLPAQKTVVALTRLLTLPQKVPKVLSTRGTGTYISIA